MPEHLSTFAVTLLAVSLATERLVVLAKTVVPFLQAPVGGESCQTPKWMRRWFGDRGRRLSVMLVGFLAAWVTAAMLAEGVADLPSYLENLLTGYLVIGGRNFPVIVVAILASGGSAFWAQIVGYASAVKDIQQSLAKQGGGVATAAPRPAEPPDLADLSWDEIKRSSNLQRDTRR